jgi:glycosyltransferase involved in cell wall biosynthesis
MIAYACEPGSGGEPSVGWFWAINAARHGHQVGVVTRRNNRDVCERALLDEDAEVRERVTFMYHDLPDWAGNLKKRGGVFALIGYYYLWQLTLLRRLRKSKTSESYDLAQHVTFCNDSVFSVAAFLGLPFVWAPTGGYTHAIPAHLAPTLTRDARSYERKRRAFQFFLRQVDPLCRMSRRRAARIMVYSNEALDAYSGWRDKVGVIRHVGVSAASVAEEPSTPVETSLPTAVTVGRLVHWKGFDLAIEAVAHARQDGHPFVLRIIGKGPQLHELKQLAARLGVQDLVVFEGHLPSHADVVNAMREARVFIQPTLRDGPPVAMLEAMSVGTLVLTADFGANREVVPLGGGIVVDGSGSRAQLIQRLAEGLMSSLDDPRREKMIAISLDHMKDCRTWEAIGQRQALLYDSLAPVGSG